MLKWFKKKEVEQDDRCLSIYLSGDKLYFADDLNQDEIVEIYLGLHTGPYTNALLNYIKEKDAEAYNKIVESIKQMTEIFQTLSKKNEVNNDDPFIPALMINNEK